MLEMNKRDVLSFNQKEILEVWEKGVEVKYNDPKEWRKDMCGNLIEFEKYNNLESKYGWVISMVKPMHLGGTTELENLLPLQWEAHEDKGDTYPYDCSKKPHPSSSSFD